MVDDNAEFTELLLSVLGQREGYEVRVVNESALALTTSLKFAPDLVLLDVVMPEFDGGDVRAQLQGNPLLKEVPIIFLTSLVDQSQIDAQQGVIGGDFYLAKPVSAERLLQSIAARFEPA